jgi:hydroxymethylpyrimidine pyrophosphatase-like HAD family hydrolase
VDTAAVVYNGAGVYAFDSRRFLYHRGIPWELACEAAGAMLDEAGIESLSVEVRDRGYFVARRRGASPLVNDTARSGFLPETVERFESIRAESVTKLMPYSPGGEIARVAEALRERFGEALYLAWTDPHLLQVGEGAVEKSVALDGVLADLGVDWPDTLAAGDNLNDLGMLRKAAVSIAPATAHEAVRAMVSGLARDPDDLIVRIDEMVGGGGDTVRR